MDLLSTAKRKDALPDPAKINPLLLKRASEVTQKAVAKNVNKTDVAEAVTMPVDRSSLIIKGQPSSGVVVSDSTFHCSVAQVVGDEVVVAAAQTKGSDIASATSILQFSEPAQHNSDDVMTSIPEDYGSRRSLNYSISFGARSRLISHGGLWRFCPRRCAGGAVAIHSGSS